MRDEDAFCAGLPELLKGSVAQDNLEEIWSVICLCLICVLKDGDHDKNRSYCAPCNSMIGVIWRHSSLLWGCPKDITVFLASSCTETEAHLWLRTKNKTIHGITLVHLSFC